jgi:hypothetical protein
VYAGHLSVCRSVGMLLAPACSKFKHPNEKCYSLSQAAMSQAPGPGWSGALRSQDPPEPLAPSPLAPSPLSQGGPPSQVVKGEDLKSELPDDPAFVCLKVKQQVHRLQPLPLPLTPFFRMEQSLTLGLNASP